MNSASQPDTPEWSKFAPLRSRLRSNSELPQTENLAAADPSSQTVSPLVAVTPVTVAIPIEAPVLDDGMNPLVAFSAPAHPAEQFVCHNRKCQDRRERHGKAPRPLYSAHWRSMKIGKRHTLVLDLTIRCPDCNFEHRATLFPPEWMDAKK
jgi:hypothetical protein